MIINILHALLIARICQFSFAGPVEIEANPPRINEDPLEALNFEEGYKKYLQEVMKVLKDDEVISQVMSQEKNGESNVENYLKLASKQTRTKLDELKRLELKRLKSLHRLANKVAQAKRRTKPSSSPIAGAEKERDWHIDQKVDADSFNLADLQLLIQKAVKQLANIDTERHKSFKQYEMKKEHDFRAGIKNLPAAILSETLQKHRDSIVRHKNHSNINYPGGKDQLVEVWNKVDHLDPQNFDPRVFFLLHDVDQDGMLSIEEIEAILQIELDKIYALDNPDDDPVERREEMNRMRERVFNDIDSDRDGMLSWKEFLASTISKSQDNHQKWKTIDDEPTFTEEEFLEYEALLKTD